LTLKEIIKIAVIGPESTGKSTLCKDLAKHYNTICVPEYAREYFTHNKNIHNYSLKELESIYVEQIKNEKAALKEANRFLFCDTTLITGKIWALEDFKEVPPFIRENITKIRYDLYLVTNNDVEWRKDELRKCGHNRDYLLQRNIEELKLLNANYVVINGTDEDRSKNAVKHINTLFTQ
jgi:NadR type nicotinamide-nucleotide adenylyltransferase